MGKERTAKRITEQRPTAVGRIDRPRCRWEDNIRVNLEKMKIQNLVRFL